MPPFVSGAGGADILLLMTDRLSPRRGPCWPAALLLLATVLAGAGGCGQSGSISGLSPAAAVSFAGLPSPAVLAAAEELRQGPARAARLAETVSIPSAPRFKESFDVSTVPPNAALTPFPGKLSYALYDAGNFAEYFTLTQLRLFTTQVEDSYFLLLPDFSRGRWDVVASGLSGNAIYSFPQGYSQYLSPAGEFYFALLSDSGDVLYNHAELDLDNRTPLPPPNGLSAEPGNGNASLSWDAYSEPRAAAIELWTDTQPSMASAVLSQTLDTTATQWIVEGLDNGKLYFFGLKAVNADGASVFSELAATTPTSGSPGDFELAAGLWPRLGGGLSSSGTSTSLSGPENLDGEVSVSLTEASTGPNRSSPVLDAQGNVYALSRDGKLLSYTADLSSLRYSFDANDYAPEGASLVCPPQAPCIDSDGNVFFVAVQAGSQDEDGFLFGVKPTGARLFQYNLGETADTPDFNYPSPNIGPGGVLISVRDKQQVPVGLNQDGTQAWKNTSYANQLTFYADPAYSVDGASFNWPCSFDGQGLGLKAHWLSLAQAGGGELARYRDFDAPDILGGGVCMPDDYCVYPESDNLLLIDGQNGARYDLLGLGGIPLQGPARVAATNFLVQAVPADDSGADLSDLRCVKLVTNPTPGLDFSWALNLGAGKTLCKPCIDKDGRIYVSDTAGEIWLAQFVAGLPPQEGLNPALIDSRPADGSNSFQFSSIALGDHRIYVVSEQNKLLLLFNPLD